MMESVLQALAPEGPSLVLSSLSRRANNYSLGKNVQSKASTRIVSFALKQISIAMLFNKAFKLKSDDSKLLSYVMIILVPTGAYIINESWGNKTIGIPGYKPEIGRHFFSIYEKVIATVIYIRFFKLGSKVTAATGLAYMVYVENKANTKGLSSNMQRVINGVAAIADLCIIVNFGTKKQLANLFVMSSVMSSLPSVFSKVPASSNEKKAKNWFCPDWGTNLVLEAKRALETNPETPSPCAGRENILNQIKVNLLMKNKNNTILIGPAGTGKTTAVKGLAFEIAQGEAGLLNGYQIVKVDLDGLLQETKWRGTLNKLVMTLSTAAKENPKLIFFIDEIQNLRQGATTQSNVDLLGLLKEYMLEDNFRVIGALIPDDTNAICSDPAVRRRFNIIKVLPPTDVELKKMMEHGKKKYEEDYNCTFTDGAINKAIELGKRSNIKLPDSALQLLNKAGSTLNFKNPIQRVVTESDIRPEVNLHRIQEAYVGGARSSDRRQSNIPPTLNIPPALMVLISQFVSQEVQRQLAHSASNGGGGGFPGL
ncbi:MAG: hypothetical protein SP4CHLAM5_02980 [Chlamydiia bacterium]|nr:hypothetical protein [Chlamydiia bacterium]MCH9618172.1 hypothetical protein [Chlamydiia bacterium]MCH9624482.1 hypothetical protein [Chlamydiia bacterium]